MGSILLEKELGRPGRVKNTLSGPRYLELAEGGPSVAVHLAQMKEWGVSKIEVCNAKAFESRRPGISHKYGPKSADAIENIQLGIPETTIHCGISQRM